MYTVDDFQPTLHTLNVANSKSFEATKTFLYILKLADPQLKFDINYLHMG